MIDHLLICVPPTPNGGLHLGHLSGPYLGCDILARALRQRGKTVLTVAGIDDHQGYVETKARRDGTSCQEVIERYGDSIRKTWKEAGFDFDLTLSTYGDADYGAFVSGFFSDMVDCGAIKRKEGTTLYDDSGTSCLFQGYVRGRCPHCGRACDGNMCEDCSLPNTGWDILDRSLTFPETGETSRTEEQLYVNPTHDWTDRLGAVAAQMRMSADRRAYIDSLAKLAGTDSADAVVAHSFAWGLPVPDGLRDAGPGVIDVWFEMAAAFLYYPRQAGLDWQEVWSSDARKSVFFGVDNSFYVAAMFPYLYSHMANVRPIDDLFCNHFLYLEGQKFSTSRNHAIWGAEFFAQEPVDIGRFYLACNRPEDRVENFSVADYEAFKAEMTAIFARLAHAVRETGFEPLLEDGSERQPDFLVSGLAKVEDALSADAFSAKTAARQLAFMLREWTSTIPADHPAYRVCAAHLLYAMTPVTPFLCDTLKGPGTRNAGAPELAPLDAV